MPDAFFLQQAQVTTVAVDDHRFLTLEQFVQLLTAVGILLDDLQMHVVGDGKCRADSSLTTAHDDHVLHILIMLLSHNLSDIGDILLGGHEVGQVVDVQLVHTARYQRVASSFDRYDMIGVVGTAEVFQGLVQDFRLIPEFDA